MFPKIDLENHQTNHKIAVVIQFRGILEPNIHENRLFKGGESFICLYKFVASE